MRFNPIVYLSRLGDRSRSFLRQSSLAEAFEQRRYAGRVSYQPLDGALRKRGRFPGRGRQAVLSFHLELAGQFLGLGGVTALKV
jgi:hypothetical protein